jgi:hypothetical protein
MAKRIGNGQPRPTHDEIAQRARKIYEQSGCEPARDLENWLEAEAQLSAARQSVAEAATPGKPLAQELARR